MNELQEAYKEFRKVADGLLVQQEGILESLRATIEGFEEMVETKLPDSFRNMAPDEYERVDATKAEDL